MSRVHPPSNIDTRSPQWMIACIAAFIVLGVSGCSVHTRYRALCLIFDGVPVPRGEVPCDGNGKPLATGAHSSPGGNGDGQVRYSQHGPYAAKMCEGCHQRQTNRLLLPVNELCLYCHVLSIKKKRVHGPVASGGCAVCHDAHGSGNPYLLVSSSQEFCLHCHERSDIMKNDVHKNFEGSCTTCHDAHASNNEFLLRESPGPNDDGTPWVKPRPKPLERKLATTAKVSRPAPAEKELKQKKPKPTSVQQAGGEISEE